MILNLFYEEPDPDRWFKYDRFPRRIIRRIIRGRERPGGVMMIAINLMKGLDRIGYPYRFNDYRYIRKHPGEIACIIGKHEVLFNREWQNPVIYGAGIYSHPIEYPDLFEQFPNVKRVLVPGDWMKKMFEPYYGNKVDSWPVGIDTDYWRPLPGKKEVDILIYYKIRWQNEKQQLELVDPITTMLEHRNISYQFVRYGSYDHQTLIDCLNVSKAVIFLCEHETQGSAYQQILATDTPIFAWDRGGEWQDEYYYPDKVKYGPVSSVPYWDERCGLKFTNAEDFGNKLSLFLTNIPNYKPRDYIMENLTLEKCAKKYVEIVEAIQCDNL